MNKRNAASLTQRPVPALSTLAVLVGSALTNGAFANPTGGQVVAGSAVIKDAGKSVDIHQSTDKAIINWQKFGIKAGEAVKFQQPGRDSVTLNRVVGKNPSALYGKLSANGTVMLVNPNGIVVGKGAVVDVGGLVATTANIRDEDFMAGRYRFDQASPNPDAAVVNEGTITIKDSGLAALVAPAVRNAGVVEAKLGKVALAGAKTFTVDFHGDGLLSFDATAVVGKAPKDANGNPVALVDNTGRIDAAGGTVLLTARAVKNVVDHVINTDGIVSATSVGTHNGKIVLSGGDAGKVEVAGTLTASGAEAGTKGGAIKVTGERVVVAKTAQLDVSGDAGGGDIALEATGPDQALSSAGTLTTNGGDIRVIAASNIDLAGTLDAGAVESGGSVAVTSQAGSIRNVAMSGQPPVLMTGHSITLSAENGHVGVKGSSLQTKTSALDITAGGDVHVDNEAVLDTLALRALHRQTTGDGTNTYELASDGLDFEINDTINAPGGLDLVNIKTTHDLDLSIRADRNMTVHQVETGDQGSVALDTTGVIYGTSTKAEDPDIISGDLTLRAQTVQGAYNDFRNPPLSLYTRVNSLSSDVAGSLRVSNDKTLQLKDNRVGASASVIVTNGSLRQDGDGAFVAPVLELRAEQSIGEEGQSVRTDVRSLTTYTGHNVFVKNQSDLTSLNLNATHADGAVINTIQVDADKLALDVLDTGSAYVLNRLADDTGLNFSFSADTDLQLGRLDAGAAGSLMLTSSTGSIGSISGTAESRPADLTVGTVTLNAREHVGHANDVLQTTARRLNLQAGGDMAVHNRRDLEGLGLTVTSAAASKDRYYGITAPELQLTMSQDEGIKAWRVTNIQDATGLDLTLNSSALDLNVGTLDVTPSGSATLINYGGDIIGQSGHRITAGRVSLSTYGVGHSIGAADNLLSLVTPQLSVTNSGDVYVKSSEHLDSLSLYNRGTVGRALHIESARRNSDTPLVFSAIDTGSNLHLTDFSDPDGLSLNVTSDYAIDVGRVDLNGLGDVTLNTLYGSIVDDGDSATDINTGRLSMTANNGGIGSAGAAVSARAEQVSAYAYGAGVHLALQDTQRLTGFYAAGDSTLTNDDGDIDLGIMTLNHHALNVDNRGGSILSGTLHGAGAVTLTAAGSIGNGSAIASDAYGAGITTLTAKAQANDRGADGSVAFTELYGLRADKVHADGDIHLVAGRSLSNNTLSVGDIRTQGDVELTSTYGDIEAAGGDNLIQGRRVSLTAQYGSGRTVGTKTQGLHLDTASLAIATPGSFYLDNAADLDVLHIQRRSTYRNPLDGSARSGGTMSLTGGGGLRFDATDNGVTATLTRVSDDTGLDFEFDAVGALKAGAIDVGAHGSATLRTAPESTGVSGAITNRDSHSLITAGTLTLEAGSASGGASPDVRLNTHVGRVTAAVGGGGNLNLVQDGDLILDRITAGGTVAVDVGAGNLWVAGDTVNAGVGKSLSLTAGDGRILSDGGMLSSTGGGASITLSAAHGIGDVADALHMRTTGGAVSATITDEGSLNLHHDGNLTGGLTTRVHNGATRVDATGDIALTDLSSGTDAAGNDIHVTTGGGIAVGSIRAGATAGEVDLDAGGSIRALGSPGDADNIRAHRIRLSGNGIGTSTASRLGATGDDVSADAGLGALYLRAFDDATYSALSGGIVDVDSQGYLKLLRASAHNGGLSVTNTGPGARLDVGALDVGMGMLTLWTEGALNHVADGDPQARLVADRIELVAEGGIGRSDESLRTRTSVLSALVLGKGDIHLDDDHADGVELRNISAQNGAIDIHAAGDILDAYVQSHSDAEGNDVVLRAGGQLKIEQVRASQHVTLSAGGAILGAARLAGDDRPHIIGDALSAQAGAGIGGGLLIDGVPGASLTTQVRTVERLASTGVDSVIDIRNLGTDPLTLASGAFGMAADGSIRLSTAGDLAVNADMGDPGKMLQLHADGVMAIAADGIHAPGTLELSAKDIVSDSAAPRDVRADAETLVFRSDSEGGDTRLHTAASKVDVALEGSHAHALDIAHDGAQGLDARVRNSNGDIRVTTAGLLNAREVRADGGDHSHDIQLESTAGDILVGIVDAGPLGSITLSSAKGSLRTDEHSHLNADTLDVLSHAGIGTADDHFRTAARSVAAKVTGEGDIYLDGVGDTGLVLRQITTADGNVAITSVHDLESGVGLSVGGGGGLMLRSEQGDVHIAHDVALADGGSLVLQAQNGVTVDGDIVLTGASKTDAARGAGLSVTARHGTFKRSITTAGAQHYAVEDVAFYDDVAAGSTLDVDGDVRLKLNDSVRPMSPGLSQIHLSAGGDLSIAGGLSGEGVDAGQWAMLEAEFGDLTLKGTAGDLSGLSAAAKNISVGPVTTGQLQSYTGSTTLNGEYRLASANGTFQISGDTTLAGNTRVSAAGGRVSFGGKVQGPQTLRVVANGGRIEFHDTLGQADDRLDTVSAAASRIDLDGGAYAQHMVMNGTVVMGGGRIDTLGEQRYGGLLQLRRGAAVTLAASNVALMNDVTVWEPDLRPTIAGGPHRSAAETAPTLTITGHDGSGGDAEFYGRVGSIENPLGALTVTGNTVLHGQAIETAGSQLYGGSVTLNGGQSLTTQTGDLRIAGAVQSAAGAADPSLHLASASGNIDLNGPVGDAARRMGSLDIRTAGTTRFGAAVHASSLEVKQVAGQGDVVIAGGLVDTTGAQSYEGHVALAGDTVLSGLPVSLSGGVDTLGGTPAASLTIDGNAVLGTVGGQHALADLTAVRTATLMGDGVRTIGSQHYQSRTRLAADQRLHSESGDITFGGTVGKTAQGMQRLEVESDSGAITFAGKVLLGFDLAVRSRTGDVLFADTVGLAGDDQGDLRVDTGGTTTFSDAVHARSVQVGMDSTTGVRPGDIFLHAGTVTTGGEQAYGGHVWLGADTLLTGSRVTLAGGADSAMGGDRPVALAIDGDAGLSGLTGLQRALASLSVSGRTTLGSASVTDSAIATEGDQRYEGDVAVAGPQRLISGAGSLHMGGSVLGQGAADLSLTAGDGINVEGQVSGLGDLVLQARNTLVFHDAVSAYRIRQLDSGSATYRQSVTASGESGMAFAGKDFVFGGDVTAQRGGIRFSNTAVSSIAFAEGSTVRAATGFTQTGGGCCSCPRRCGWSGGRLPSRGWRLCQRAPRASTPMAISRWRACMAPTPA